MGEGLVLQVGRYGLFGPMAAGGMAEVHFGRFAGEGGFQKTIAIKRLLPHVAQNPDCRTMIYEEARLAARIRHPNVVQSLDVITTDDEVLLAMEYVHGEALSKLIMRARKLGEPVPPEIGMAIACEMLQGLHAAHEAKDENGRALDIVHRDVSPQNVLVGADGVARVIDFGIAKAVNSSDLTAVGHVKGKLPYLAPEQFSGASASRLSDIYAAGCIAWELLVGRRLFDGDSDQAVAGRILRAPVDPPSAFVNGVPEEIDAIIMRSVERDPKMRFPTAREMALAIERVMPLARATRVGEWVEHLVGPELEKRAARIAEIERLRFEFTPPQLSVRRTLPPNDAMPSSSRARGRSAPSLGDPFAGGSAQAKAQVSAQSPAGAPAPSPFNALPPASIRPPQWKADIKPPQAGELQKPALEIPNVKWLPAPVVEPKAITITKPRKVSGTMFAVVILLIGVTAFVLALPTIVRRGYEKSAAAQGLLLTIDRTEVTFHRVKLLDVSMRMADLPWWSAKANAIDVDLAGIEPAAITVRGLDVTVNGGIAELEASLTRFSAVQNDGAFGEPDGRRKPKLVVEGARVTWGGALGKATTITAENVDATAWAEPSTVRGTSPIVTIATASGAHAGPFRVDYERTPLATRVWLRLDPSGAKATSAVVTLDPTGPASLEVNVPRSRPEELWLPASSGLTNVMFTLQAKVVPGGKTEGRVDGVLMTAQGQELHFDAALGASEPNGSLVVLQGTADLAGQKLRPGGLVAVSKSGFDISLFASCDAVPDVQAFAAALDTKDISESGKIGVVKDLRCQKGAR